MKSKIFEAATIQRALAQVKEEMGPDAMILSTKKIPRSPRNPYAKGKFAVEAAPKEYFPESKTKNSNIKFTSCDKNFPYQKDEVSGIIKDEASSGIIKDDLVSIKDILPLMSHGNRIQEMVINYPESAPLFALLLKAGISEKMAGSIMHNSCSSMENDRRRYDCGVTEQEIDKGKNPGKGKTDCIASLKNYVIKECAGLLDTRNLFAESDVLDNTDTFKTDIFKKSNTDESKRHIPRGGLPCMAAFVGPTGVGKTTTIAKLAAELTFKRKKRVGLISIDNYRVGAFEQLKAYASIMGIGCIPAFSTEDFSMAIDKMCSMDIILIDTAGHSHSDKIKMDELAGVVNGSFNVSVHLVLSMATGAVDMKEAATAFAVLNPVTYVFTKIDETRMCGKIFDQINELKMPVSLITNGQRVPEDLIIPDRKKLLSIILGTENNSGCRIF